MKKQNILPGEKANGLFFFYNAPMVVGGSLYRVTRKGGGEFYRISIIRR